MRIFLPVLIVSLLLCLVSNLDAQSVSYREDYNTDGRVNVIDVIRLVLDGRGSPLDPRVDYNRDGTFTLADPVMLLVALVAGQRTALAEPTATLGGISFQPTWNAVGLEVSYQGALTDSSIVLLSWREAGGDWRFGPDMTPAQGSSLLHSSIYPLEPGTAVDVRVSIHTPGQAAGTTLRGSSSTLEMVLEPAGGTTLHVSPGGDDSNPGTEESPLRTIARAAEMVSAGDVVMVHEGLYREGNLGQRISGTAQSPVVFMAAPGENPVIDTSLEIAPGDSAVWTELTGGFHATDIAWNIEDPEGRGYEYVAQDGERMFRYDSYSEFTDNTLDVPRSWYYSESSGKLYVRTGTGDSPAGHRYNIAQMRYGFFLTGSHHVVVRGFEIRYAGQACVRISEGATGCIVYGNSLHNAPNGVYLKNSNTNANAVWRNEIYEPGLPDIPWSAIKAGGYPRQGIQAWLGGEANSYNYNTMHGWFDGIAVVIWDQPGMEDGHRDTDIMFNHLYNIGDDAFELDGGGINMRLHGNTARNAMVAISLAPIERGPVYVTRNDCDCLNLYFKLNSGIPLSHGWTYCYHNSGYSLNSGNGMGMIGLVRVHDSGGSDARNKVFMNNALQGADRAVRDGQDGNTLDYNCYYHVPGLDQRKFEWNGTTYFTFEEFREATGQEEHGLYADPEFADPVGMGQTPWKGFLEDEVGNYPLVDGVEHGDMRLSPGSPCIDAGKSLRGFNDFYIGEAPDIGAFESGE